MKRILNLGAFVAITFALGQLLLVGCSALMGGASDGLADKPIAPPSAGGAVPTGGKELWAYSLDILAYLIAYAAGSIGKGWVRGKMAERAEAENEL